MSADEIVNPGRGFFRWIYQETAPVLCKDRYSRYNWSVIETAKGVYDYSVLDKEADAAKAAGGTFGFGIRNVVSGTFLACPQYVTNEVDGWVSAKKTSWVPDWNSDTFLSRIEAFVNALGARYNRDPRIGYIEIRTYGNWGEWHLSGYEAPPSPMEQITEASIHRIIDAWVRAFPDKQLIMMSDHPEGLRYAMSLTNIRVPIGWRRDSWCNKHMHTLKKSIAWPLAEERWKTAPVTVESYGGSGHTSSLGLEQIREYHVSGIGNGNFGKKWEEFPAQDQQELLACAKASGFRYALRSLTITPGAKTGFTAQWVNYGVCPVYREWRVIYRLRDPGTDAVVWQQPSKIDLRSVLPAADSETKADAPVTVCDIFTMSEKILPGQYRLEIIVTDPSGYFAEPLALAIMGRTNDGAYVLGTAEITAK